MSDSSSGDGLKLTKANPILGPLLIVATFIILSAVIGISATAMGDTLGGTGSDIELSSSYNNTSNTVVIYHSGYDTISPENTGRLQLEGNYTNGLASQSTPIQWSPSKFFNPNPGDREAVVDTRIEPGDEIVRVMLTDDRTVPREITVRWVSPTQEISSEVGTVVVPASGN